MIYKFLNQEENTEETEEEIEEETEEDDTTVTPISS